MGAILSEPWKRKEVIGNATLYLGDCLEILPTLPKVDAVITDPPYGIAYRHGGRPNNGYADRTLAIVGDDRPFDPSPWLLFKPCILWGANHYCDKLTGSKSWLVWDKRCGMTPDDGADAEMAWTNIGKQLRVHRQIWRGAYRQGEENIATGTAKEHPAQKPQALMRFCIEYAGSPHLILDPYMGSGSTGVAAMSMQRKFIGIEIEPKYFDIACERITNAQRQERLFA